MTQLATHRPPSHNELWALAYADGANNRGLHGHRLENYAACYADTAPCLPFEATLDAFWQAWSTGHFDAEVYGPWKFVA